MTKLNFLLSLRHKLRELPQDDIEERLNFYSEMIEDRMEEGLSEEEAVLAVGNVDEIAAQILSEISLAKNAKKKTKPKKRLKVWQTVFLVCGAPIWGSLLVAAFAVIFSLYISLWAVLISLWAVFVSIVACAFCGVVAGIGLALGGNRLTGTAIIGAGMVCAGVSIFLFFGCRKATKAALLLTKKIPLWFKNCCLKKGEA